MAIPNTPLGYRGRRAGSVDTALAVVSCTEYAGGLALPAHAHEQANLCAVIAGGFEERWGRRTVELSAGRLLAKPAGVEHADRFGPAGARVLNFDLRPGFEGRLGGLGAALAEPTVADDPRLALVFAELERELREPDDLTLLAVEAAVLALSAALTRARRRARCAPSPAWLERLPDALRGRAAEPLRLEDLAAELGLSADHVARCFRERYGTPLATWLRRCRVEAAIRALRDGDLPLAEVALRCGFYDQSHLCRVFKRVTGSTPSAWRAQHS